MKTGKRSTVLGTQLGREHRGTHRAFENSEFHPNFGVETGLGGITWPDLSSKMTKGH
jgi:hypothetical protein